MTWPYAGEVEIIVLPSIVIGPYSAPSKSMPICL